MGKRAGSLLEKNMEKLFNLKGFSVVKNSIINGYEVDLLATKNGKKIICQCKQYERSYINVKDLIHLWDSKNKNLHGDKVLIVIYGQPIKEDEKTLALSSGTLIWGEEELDKAEKLSNEEFFRHLELETSNFKTDDYTYKPSKQDIYIDLILLISGILLLRFVVGIIPLIFLLARVINRKKKNTRKV